MVPAGGHLHYWDSGSGSAAAANSGMEISNHWGAVDRDTRVPLPLLPQRPLQSRLCCHSAAQLLSSAGPQ